MGLCLFFEVWFFDQFTRTLCYLRNQLCYMLCRDLLGCQSCSAFDTRIDIANERLHSVYLTFVDNALERSNVKLCKRQTRSFVCGVSVSTFAFTTLFESFVEFSSNISSHSHRLFFGNQTFYQFPPNPGFELAELCIFVIVHQKESRTRNCLTPLLYSGKFST